MPQKKKAPAKKITATGRANRAKAIAPPKGPGDTKSTIPDEFDWTRVVSGEGNVPDTGALNTALHEMSKNTKLRHPRIVTCYVIPTPVGARWIALLSHG